jgi:hypothetical protein
MEEEELDHTKLPDPISDRLDQMEKELALFREEVRKNLLERSK